MALTLRPYQEDIISKVLKSDKYEVIIELPTGAGKSVIISELAKYYSKNYNVVVLTETSTLIDQLDRHLKDFDINANIIKANKHRTTDSNVYLIMEQSLHENRRKEFKLNNCVVLRDEIHKGKEGKRFNDIVNHLNPVKLIGLSATPYNEKGIYCGGSDSEYIVGTTITELEKQGYLVPTRYYIPKIVKKIEFDKIKDSGNDYSLKDIEDVYRTDIIMSYLDTFFRDFEIDKRKTLIICSTVEHAERMFELVKNHHTNGAVVHSKKKDEHNQKAIEMFKEGHLDYLVSVSMLTIGFNAPRTDTLINLRPTKIRRLWVQLAGRIKRPYGGKKESFLYDFGNCLINIGFPEDKYEPSKENIAHRRTKSNENQFLEQYIDNVSDEIVEVSKAKLELFIQEIRRLEEQELSNLDIHSLIKLFRTTDRIDILVKCANEYHRRKYGWSYKPQTVDLMIKNAKEVFEKLSLVGKENSTFKAYKTRLRNILNEGKVKLSSFIYFPEWFYQSTLEKYPWLKEEAEIF